MNKLFRYITNLFGCFGRNKLISGPIRLSASTDNALNRDHVSELEMIKNHIKPSTLTTITKMLDHAYKLEGIIAEPECIICYDVRVPIVPLACAHFICEKCYSKLLETKYVNCPMCRTVMKQTAVYKMIAIVTTGIDFDLGIIYFPPIIETGKNETWYEYEIFYHLDQQNDIIKLTDACMRMCRENYYIIYETRAAKKCIHKLTSDIVELPSIEI